MRNFLRSPVSISVLIGLICSLVFIAEPLDQIYWNVRYRLSSHAISQPVIVIPLDNQGSGSTKSSGWTTMEQARLLELVRRQVPRKVVLDARVDTGQSIWGDRALARAIGELGDDFSLVLRNNSVDADSHGEFLFPASSVVPRSRIAISKWNANFIDFATTAPYAVRIDGKSYPTVGPAVAGIRGREGGVYVPDFSLDPDSVPQLPVSKLLNGKFAPGLLTGRTVVISDFGTAGRPIGYFGHGRTPDIALAFAGAEGLRRPFAIVLPRLVLLGLLAVCLALAANARSRREKALFYSAACAVTFVLPAILVEFGILSFTDQLLATMAIYGSIRLWQKWRRRVQHTSASGLPNLLSLTSKQIEVGRDVVVAVIARYEEILATLPKELHGECARQIARRLSVGSGRSEIYNGDGGHFAWTEEARPLEMQLNHLEGLRALFSAPLQIGEHTFDTNIHFGLDRNEGVDALARVNSALASANEALTSGRSIELFEAARLAEAPWELSLHARIDEGLRNGDIWLAFQPQWDFSEKRFCGAEALIRWNHPTRGPIAPDAFILQAERAGRIDALTFWVLEEAITAALEINALGPRFQMSINLSAQMVDKPNLVSNIAEVVQRRGIDPSLLTIEVTETSSVHNRPAARHNLSQLRALGFRLSIDDFGTGEASLSYLAELPSDELKIDRRFVSRITTAERERAIVAYTIALAHDLHQEVVAEGIEDEATLQLLMELGCDYAQGYYLGKPQSFADFIQTYRRSADIQIGIV